MTLTHIDNKAEPVWRCEARTHFPPVTFRRIRFADFGIPDRLEKTVYGEISSLRCCSPSECFFAGLTLGSKPRMLSRWIQCPPHSVGNPADR